MAEPRSVLAWDLGTSAAKVGLVGADGEVIDSDSESVPQILLPDGGAEQRPDDWWTALVLATRRLVSRNAVAPSSIAAMSVTGQWAGTVAVDRAGRPMMNAIIWMDSRGAPFVHDVVGGAVRVLGYSPVKALRWIRLTGGAPGQAGKDSLAHILYVKHRCGDVYRSTHKFLEPKDYVNLRLTGLCKATFDSIAMHWITDNRRAADVHYDQRLLDAAGLDREKFPELCAATDVLGPLRPEAAAELGLDPSVVVIAGTPDVHSAAVGAGATADHVPHLYVGTSSWIACHVPSKGTDVLHNMAALPAPIAGRYILLNGQETAGACLNHLRDKLFFPDDALATSPAPTDAFARFDRAAAGSPPGSHRLIFLPWLYGERTPVEDRLLRGAFFNYSLDTERADVIRSVYEGVAYNARWLFESVESYLGHRIPELRFVGGGAKSELWCQIFADVLGRPILRVRQPMLANLRGAGLLAFVALGELGWDEVPHRVGFDRRFEPKPDHQSIYSEMFREFMALYHRTKAIFARLNR